MPRIYSKEGPQPGDRRDDMAQPRPGWCRVPAKSLLIVASVMLVSAPAFEQDDDAGQKGVEKGGVTLDLSQDPQPFIEPEVLHWELSPPDLDPAFVHFPRPGVETAWEYRVIQGCVLDHDECWLGQAEERLNRLGMEGWEMTHALPRSDSWLVTFILKRRHDD